MDLHVHHQEVPTRKEPKIFRNHTTSNLLKLRNAKLIVDVNSSKPKCRRCTFPVSRRHDLSKSRKQTNSEDLVFCSF